VTPNTWIVAVNYNGLDDTRKCLDSLAKLAAPANVVVVDNASTIDPRESLQKAFPWAVFVRNDINLGWSGGNNTGIRLAMERGAELILLLNNDTTVAPELIDRLHAAVVASLQFGILGPIIRDMAEPGLTMTDGVVFNRPGYPGFFQRSPVPEVTTNPTRIQEVDIVNGCAMLIRAEVFRRIGLIDDRFFLIHEEADFCLRAQEAGFRCGILAEPLVWHKGSSAFKQSGKRWQRYYDTRNLGLLLAKHTAHANVNRRGISAYAHYLRYAYHRYCHEREDGQRDAADAVLEGLVDTATRRYGAYQKRPRLSVPILRSLFEAARRVKSAKSVGAAPTDARRDLWNERERA